MIIVAFILKRTKVVIPKTPENSLKPKRLFHRDVHTISSGIWDS